MKTWLRLLLVLMSVGGGFTGIVLVGEKLFDFSKNGILGTTLFVAFFGLYSFVTASGLLFVYDSNRTRPLVIALAMQIPWVSCPVFVYQFASGMHAAVTLGTPDETSRFGLHLGWNLLFGTHFQFRVGGFHDIPWTFGVNVVALVLLGAVLKSVRNLEPKKKPANSEVPESFVI